MTEDITIKSARCKNCKWFSREQMEVKWPHKGSGITSIKREKKLLEKGFGRCMNTKMDEQAPFYDYELVGLEQPDYAGTIDYTGMIIDCGANEWGFLFHETFGCVNFEKRKGE